MAVITNLFNDTVKPSDVFGYEVNTDVGYGRETFEITVTDKVRVGTVLELDYAAKTAKVVDGSALAGATQVKALGELGVFVGRDLPTNPTTAQDFDNLTMTAKGKGVVIVKGDGRGVLKKGYLDLGGTAFYKLSEEAQKALSAKFTTENRFKVIDQQYTA